MKEVLKALTVLLVLTPITGRCAEVMTVCDVFEQGERLRGEVVWLSGIYVTGPTVESGLTDDRCPSVRIPMSFAREHEREKVTSQFRAAISYLYFYNVALRLQVRAIVLSSDRAGPHIEIDNVYSFQVAVAT